MLQKSSFETLICDLIKKIINRLVRKPKLERLFIYSRNLDDIPSFQAKIPVEFSVLPSDVDKIEAELTSLPSIHRPDIPDRVRHGHICCVGKYQGKLVHVAWTGYNNCYSYLFDRTYPLAADEAYIYSAFTFPEFRGQGIQPVSSCYRMQMAYERGCKKIICFIEPQNHAAQRMPKKLAFEYAGVTGMVEIFGVRGYFHRDNGTFSLLKNNNYLVKV